MARVTYQPCAVCTTKIPVRPQAPHAKFCSTKCRMQYHRQEKKEQQIKTEGNNTMSSASKQTSATLPMQFVFSESEFQARCQNEKAFYESRIEKPHTGILGAIVEFTPATLVEALEVYHQQRAVGWTPLDPMSAYPGAMLIESGRASFITMHLRKPECEQEKDLAKICNKVKADYEAELAAALDTEVDRQVMMSLAKDERDRQRAEKKQRLNREQQVRDELAASRAKLREELIKSGKLNADGSAA
ncbi:hypothetical protein [Pseudomonas sp. AF76]|uniref:hypothetical protein n=1 Tax=Pseudomonas sp. AF76 TaxID=554393 RepID=UPI0011CE31AA|nr:hypothetical protein [Pseudomonas sp. AF76]